MRVVESLASQIKGYEKKLMGYAKVQVPRAAASALNKIVPKVRTGVVKTVTTEVKVPARFIRKQIFSSRAKSNSLSAYVKSYLRPISLARLISPATLAKSRGRGTNRRGVRAAGQQFDGAFVNVGKNNGRWYVLRRQGKPRYPVEVINIKIDGSITANQLPIAKRFHRADFARLYAHELKFRLEKYGR